MIGSFDRAFLLAGACVRCAKNRIGSVVDRLRQLRDLRLRILLFIACVIFLRLLSFCALYFACVFFSRKTLRALRAFEWKPGFTECTVRDKQLQSQNRHFSKTAKFTSWQYAAYI